ncbi:hypothetical protein KKD61_01850 [Patescibacteria group bacterium]|nr:hypothetical protein [Patescibacteria group bacterium]
MIALLIGTALFIIVGLILGYREAKDKKNYFIKVAIFLPLSISLIVLFGPLFLISPVKIGYKSIKDDGIVVFYSASSEIVETERIQNNAGQPLRLTHRQMAELAMKMTKSAIQSNQNFYLISLKTKVLLAKNDNDLFRFGGLMKGGGTGNELGVVISERFLNEKLIAHELSHKAIRNLLGPISSLKIPTWFDEGMATFIAKQDQYASLAVLKREYEQGGYFEDLGRWEGFLGGLRWKFNDIGRHNTLYGQVYNLLTYLSDRYGEEKIYQTIIGCKTQSFHNSFEKTFGLSSDQFHQQFIEYLKTANLFQD